MPLFFLGSEKELYEIIPQKNIEKMLSIEVFEFYIGLEQRDLERVKLIKNKVLGLSDTLKIREISDLAIIFNTLPKSDAALDEKLIKEFTNEISEIKDKLFNEDAKNYIQDLLNQFNNLIRNSNQTATTESCSINKYINLRTKIYGNISVTSSPDQET